MKMKKWDLIKLEQNCRDAYSNYLKSSEGDNEKEATSLVMAIQELSLAILNVGAYWAKTRSLQDKTGVTLEEHAYDYSVYLYTRIKHKDESKRFDPSPNLTEKGELIPFPWQSYIDLNLRSTVTSTFKKLNDDRYVFGDDVWKMVEETDLDKVNAPDTLDTYDDKTYKDYLYRTLKMFYTKSDINRLYPIAREHFAQRRETRAAVNMSNEEVNTFYGILLAISRRLLNNDKYKRLKKLNKETYKNIVSKTLKSSLFLSTAAKVGGIDERLLTSIDMDSLYRLVYSFGGSTISVPTQEDFETFSSSVVAVTGMVTEGKSVRDMCKVLNKEYGLCVSELSLSKTIDSMVIGSDIFEEDAKSDPIMTIFKDTLDSWGKVLEGMSEKLDKADFSDMLNYYKELNTSLNNMTTYLDRVQTKKIEELEISSLKEK